MEEPGWLRQLWKYGTINRLPYLLIGIVLVGFKYQIDSAVAREVYGRVWTPWDYFVNGSTLSTLLSIREDRSFFMTLLAISLPFVVVGVTLTYARLRSAGVHPLLVVLFFMPVLNLILILLLVFLKPKEEFGAAASSAAIPAAPAQRTVPRVLSYGTDQQSQEMLFIRRFLPESPRASLWLASTVSAGAMLVMTWLGVAVLQSYGWGVFVAIPFLCGLIAAVLHGATTPRTLKQCLQAAALAPTLLGVGIVVVAIDGVLCVLMALPIILPLSLLGGAVGYLLQRTPLQSGDIQRLIPILIFFLPLFLGAEYIAHPPAPVYSAVTFVDVNAPPQRVWKQVVAFSKIGPPEEWFFLAGIAYPIEAKIDGRGVGAVRHCIFSTGEFTEPITEWDENKLLKFDVTSNPPAMREISPYNIHPPHVRDFLISHGGQFRLIPLAGGGTRLEGTTWYEHNLWPAGYWRFWSDFLIHRIHLRVLKHVKQLAETAPR